ncbi:MAG: 1-acyl-sn-glycerol-3-phosphate acyltransferase [Spirochaetales bacterium]|nr:1-acyl-sn-glycerol-3-phosphate acyltransferase [Spirochaetales bacterium]
MHWVKKIIYKTIQTAIKLQLNLFYDFRVWGAENIPPGPKIYCSNHFSSSDPGFVITLMKEPVHMVIGSAFGIPVLNSILSMGEQINAYSEEDRRLVVPRAVEFLKKGESVYIFPEGDLNDQLSLKRFYLGLAKVYMACPVPVIPIGLISPRRNVEDKDITVKEVLYHQLRVVSRNYYANIGPPVDFPESVLDPRDAEYEKKRAIEITDLVKARIEELILDIRHTKFWS